MLTIDASEFQACRELLARACGIVVSTGQEHVVASRLESLVRDAGFESLGSFVRSAALRVDTRLRDRLVDAIVPKETSWFRDVEVWKLLREVMLPELDDVAGREPGRPLRLWSAGCATGQEPYGLAMLIDEYAPQARHLRADGVEIVGTDVSKTALEVARCARYSAMSMDRGGGAEWPKLRARYFAKSGDQWQLAPEVARRVTLCRGNLHDSVVSGRFDLVLLRNVLVYQAERARRTILERIARQLRPGGVLILGTAESAPALPELEEIVRGRSAFYRRV